MTLSKLSAGGRNRIFGDMFAASSPSNKVLQRDSSVKRSEGKNETAGEIRIERNLAEKQVRAETTPFYRRCRSGNYFRLVNAISLKARAIHQHINARIFASPVAIEFKNIRTRLLFYAIFCCSPESRQKMYRTEMQLECDCTISKMEL